MSKTKEKHLPLAIGLNLLLAGAGYMYMGKWLVGIAGMLLILAIFWNTTLDMVVPMWLVINAIMAFDMWFLFRKNKAKIIAESTRSCPSCAELIKKEAKICRFCNTAVEQTPA